VADCEFFMDATPNWAESAAEIGWDALSLFGCSPRRPIDHMGSAGLLWHVAGGKIMRLYSDWVMIDMPDGAHHRRSSTVGMTLPWSLR
jgi:hypothetical protein